MRAANFCLKIVLLTFFLIWSPMFLAQAQTVTNTVTRGLWNGSYNSSTDGSIQLTQVAAGHKSYSGGYNWHHAFYNYVNESVYDEYDQDYAKFLTTSIGDLGIYHSSYTINNTYFDDRGSDLVSTRNVSCYVLGDAHVNDTIVALPDNMKDYTGFEVALRGYSLAIDPTLVSTASEKDKEVSRLAVGVDGWLASADDLSRFGISSSTITKYMVIRVHFAWLDANYETMNTSVRGDARVDFSIFGYNTALKKTVYAGVRSFPDGNYSTELKNWCPTFGGGDNINFDTLVNNASTVLYTDSPLQKAVVLPRAVLFDSIPAGAPLSEIYFWTDGGSILTSLTDASLTTKGYAKYSNSILTQAQGHLENNSTANSQSWGMDYVQTLTLGFTSSNTSKSSKTTAYTGPMGYEETLVTVP